MCIVLSALFGIFTGLHVIKKRTVLEKWEIKFSS